MGPISPAAGGTLYQQIVDRLKREVSDGRLAPGAALPSFRQLAEDLLVSVITRQTRLMRNWNARASFSDARALGHLWPKAAMTGVARRSLLPRRICFAPVSVKRPKPD